MWVDEQTLIEHPGTKQHVAVNMLLVVVNKIHVARTSTCCRATCCPGVNAALSFLRRVHA